MRNRQDDEEDRQVGRGRSMISRVRFPVPVAREATTVLTIGRSCSWTQFTSLLMFRCLRLVVSSAKMHFSRLLAMESTCSWFDFPIL
jgi:hypothetical protein